MSDALIGVSANVNKRLRDMGDGTHAEVVSPGASRMSGAVFASGTLANGDLVSIPMAGAPVPCVIGVTAVTGDTVTVTYSRDGGVTWKPLIPASVTSADQEWRLGSGVTHFGIQRTAGTGTTSTYQVL